MKRILFFAALGGVLIAILKFIEYKHFVHAYPTEVYGGLVAVIFTIVGAYVGLRLTTPKEKEVVVVKEVIVREPAAPLVRDEAKIREIGLTPREQEILALIAAGHSNREIAEKLFVSENTVKTHSSRVFEKLGVNRRVQAVQKGRELGLIP
ncbi:MAG: helix-turn-helix domain-containing protein [Thermoanaerobaculia bacterium]